MALGDNLCTPEDPDTGGGIARALENPSASTQYIWATGAGQQSDFIFATAEAAGRAMCAYYNESYVSLYNITLTGSYVHCRRSDGSEDNWDVRAKPNPNYDPNGPAFNPPDVAGDNIAGNPRAAAGIGAAAAAKARGASDSAANAAAHAAAAATGTGNPARANAAGNTAAAAGAAAAAAEAAGGSAEDVKKAARDAANTAAAAADKAQPDEKTCQSNGASVDGRYCTDATAQPKPNSVPVFCTWALVVCTFIDWVKDEPATATAQETAVEPEKDSYDNYDLPSNPHKQVNITFGGQCPSDVTIPVFMCIEWNFSYHAACEIAGYAKYAFIGVASITAVFIVTGNRESE